MPAGRQSSRHAVEETCRQGTWEEQRRIGSMAGNERDVLPKQCQQLHAAVLGFDALPFTDSRRTSHDTAYPAGPHAPPLARVRPPVHSPVWAAALQRSRSQ